MILDYWVGVMSIYLVYYHNISGSSVMCSINSVAQLVLVLFCAVY